jgi:hypothetical protein
MPEVGSCTLRICVTFRPLPPSSRAMASAVGRCEAEPAAYRTASPVARPASSVMRNDTAVVFASASWTTAYTPTARAKAFRQPGRPVRPIIVTKAMSPARYGSRASTRGPPGRDMMIA